MLKAIEKSKIVSQLVDFATNKQNKDLAKNDGKKKTRLTGIPKLEDANQAGGRGAEDCTLILTEGTTNRMHSSCVFNLLAESLLLLAYCR
jgi:DNA topoisomerase-2